MAKVSFPDEEERRAFVDKLGQFRAGLPPSEQRMFDAMAIAAFGAREAGDVQGYGWYFGAAYADPLFYDAGWAAQWAYTPWGEAYRLMYADA